MISISETIEINGTISNVYNTYFDIKGWKNVLSDVLDVSVIKDTEELQEFNIKVIKNGNQETVHTIRKCVKDSRIEVIQPVPPPQVITMEGIWLFEKLSNEKTIVTATRRFLTKQGIDPQVYKINLSESLKRNLLHFKNYIEGLGIIDVQEIIDTTMTDIMRLFWDIENWNSIWNPILKTKCTFDNNYLQMFSMEVEREGIVESIEGVQIKNDKSIDFYNTVCPPKLSLHCGKWKFKELNGKVLVSAIRLFKMEKSYEDEFMSYKNNLRDRLVMILKCFKEHFREREYY